MMERKDDDDDKYSKEFLIFLTEAREEESSEVTFVGRVAMLSPREVGFQLDI